MVTRAELLAKCKTIPIERILGLRGIASRGRRFPCVLCGGRVQCGWSTKDETRWICGHSACQGRGNGVDLWLITEGLDLRTWGDGHWEALERLAGETVTPWTPPARKAAPVMTQRTIEWIWQYSMKYADFADKWLMSRRVRRRAGDCGAIPRTEWSALPRARRDLREAARAGTCAVFPLRSTHPDRVGTVRNLVIRPVNPTVCGPDGQPWKARCLNSGEGSTRDEGWPLVYGDPVGALECRTLVVCEGALDRIVLRRLAHPSWGVVGAFCADDLHSAWVRWLSGFRGKRLILVPHRDKATKAHPEGHGMWAMAKMIEQLMIPSPTWDYTVVDVWDAFGAEVMGSSDVDDLVRLDRGTPLMKWRELVDWWQGVVG